MTPDTSLLYLAGSIGAVIGVGKLLITGVPLKQHVGLFLGHAIVSGGISLAGLSVLAVLPGMAFAPAVGIAAASAVGGVVFLEKIVNRILNVPPQDK